MRYVKEFAVVLAEKIADRIETAGLTGIYNAFN